MPNFADTSGFHKTTVGRHDQAIASHQGVVTVGQQDASFTYKFENFFHPFVGELIAKLNRDSLPGMLDATWQDNLKTADPLTDLAHDFFNILYNPTETDLVRVEHFRKE